MNGDIALRRGWRAGARATQSRISDGLAEATLNEGALRLEGRTAASWRTDVSGGPAQLAVSGVDGWLTVLGDIRTRWRGHGALVEMRAQRTALGTTPTLVANRAVRSEAKLGVELPVGALRLRASQRVGFLTATGETGNQRLQSDIAAVLPFGWRGDVSAQYHRVAYERASGAGYFAPRQVETVEGGTYWDLGGDGAVRLSFDLGAGGQRIALQGSAVGPWKLALRGWATLAIDLSRTLQWSTEGEAYSAPFAPQGAVTAPDWRYGSIRTGFLLRLRTSP